MASSGTVICPPSSRANDTATGCTAPTIRRPVNAATRTSCCWTRTQRRSTVGFIGISRLFGYTFGDPDSRNDDDSAECMPKSVVISPFFDWGVDRPPRPRLRRFGDLRGARQRVDTDSSRHPRAVAWYLCGGGASGDHRSSQVVGRHGDRVDAGAPFRERLDVARQGPVELLGLQHDRVLRAGLQIQQQSEPGRSGAGVQGHGAGPARGGHRGDPRRRLQPHRRGQSHGPDVVDARHRQRRLLPAGRRRQALLHGLHRHRQHIERPATHTRCS